MIKEYALQLCKNEKPIDFKYMEVHYPITDTHTRLYDAYKLNIMLSDGLAAVLNERNDIYNTFAGDLLFFSPQELHHGRILRQGIHKYLEFLIPTDYFPNYHAFDALFNDSCEHRSNLISPVAKDRTEILKIANQMIESLCVPNEISETELLQLLLSFLSLCCKLYEKKEDNNQNIPAALQNAIRFIKERHAEKIQISDVAATSHCSASYLSRIFKKHLGKSPYVYLMEYRLFTAEQYLRNGCAVTDAAMLSGFSDASVFIKCFKRAFGVTPFRYQKENR